ncbi:MAG: DinB family protein [Planctomycetaceae bacterium]
MTTNDAIRESIASANMISSTYLSDLTDEEMLYRPCAGANHINWQVGHLIVSEHQMIEQARPGSMPALPQGFAERYSRETASLDGASNFDSKADLLATAQQQRAATLKNLDAITDDASFDAPTGISYAPTVGHLFLMQGTHWLMHAGQWALIRRQLGRPALI